MGLLPRFARIYHQVCLGKKRWPVSADLKSPVPDNQGCISSGADSKSCDPGSFQQDAHLVCASSRRCGESVENPIVCRSAERGVLRRVSVMYPASHCSFVIGRARGRQQTSIKWVWRCRSVYSALARAKVESQLGDVSDALFTIAIYYHVDLSLHSRRFQSRTVVLHIALEE